MSTHDKLNVAAQMKAPPDTKIKTVAKQWPSGSTSVYQQEDKGDKILAKMERTAELRKEFADLWESRLLQAFKDFNLPVEHESGIKHLCWLAFTNKPK